MLRQCSLRSSRDLKRPVVLTRLEEGREEPPWNAEAVRDGTGGEWRSLGGRWVDPGNGKLKWVWEDE